MSRVSLPLDIEKEIVASLIHGGMSPSEIKKLSEGFSDEGKAIVHTVGVLLSNGARTPLTGKDLEVTGEGLLGLNRAELHSYLSSLQSYGKGENVGVLAKIAKGKAALVDIIDEAGSQLSSGKVDWAKLRRVLDAEQAAGTNDLKPLSDLEEAPHQGIELKSLPSISKATDGISGVWVIGGVPGLGKSTLAWQIALELGRKMPVLYYDVDGMGASWFRYRTKQILGANSGGLKDLLKQVYVCSDAHKIHEHTARIEPPGLVVIDSFQTLPAGQDKRMSLDRWANTLKGLSGKGYTVLMVSEIPRDKYGEVSMDVFKETGSIEYAGSLCAVLTQAQFDGMVNFNVVKYRHKPIAGKCFALERDPEKVWWFKDSSVAKKREEFGDLF